MPRKTKETTEFTDLHEVSDAPSTADLEYEELLFENTSEKSRRFLNLPLIAGFGLLGAVIIFLLQRIGIVPGSGFQDAFIVFPLIGLLLILLFGLSPRRRRRSRRAARRVRKAELKQQKLERKVRGTKSSLSGKLEKSKLKLPPKSRKKYLAGVCGGIAERIGMNPTLFRVLFIISLAATGGSVPLIAYILFAIFMPPAEDRTDLSL